MPLDSSSPISDAPIGAHDFPERGTKTAKRSRRRTDAEPQPAQAEFERRTLALASAAHELKTPLAILNGYADLLLGEKLGALNPKQREVLQEMQATRMRLQHFIEDFLNYSVIATGNLKLRIEPNDIRQCANEICGVWLPRFQEKLIAFYSLNSAVMDPFPFDFYKVQHIISNLLHNALKFTPAGGTGKKSTGSVAGRPSTATRSCLPSRANFTWRLAGRGPGVRLAKRSNKNCVAPGAPSPCGKLKLRSALPGTHRRSHTSHSEWAPIRIGPPGSWDGVFTSAYSNTSSG